MHAFDGEAKYLLRFLFFCTAVFAGIFSWDWKQTNSESFDERKEISHEKKSNCSYYDYAAGIYYDHSDRLRQK